MTITETPATEPRRHPVPGSVWIKIGATLGALVLLGGGLITYERVHAMDDEYGPISIGSFGSYGSPLITRDRDGWSRLYTIRRPPECQNKPLGPDGGALYVDRHDVHWESLLGDHTTTIGGLDPLDGSLQVC